MIDRIAKIISTTEVGKDIFETVFECDEIGSPVGGQFVEILLPNKEHILRRPFCICDFDKTKNTIMICYAVVGDGTKCLSQLCVGTTLNMLFPLGHGFESNLKNKKIMLIGGGMGAAVLPAVARVNSESEIFTYLGFASKDKVVLTQTMSKLSKSVVVATDDGSCGEKGFVTDMAEKDLDKIKPDYVFCCGPAVMYKAVKRVFSKFDIPVYVSLEQRMACGIGACLGCSCKIIRDGQTQFMRVCKDGPVFKLDEVEL